MEKHARDQAIRQMEKVIKSHKLQQASKLKQEGTNFNVTLVPLPDVHFTKNFVRVEKFSFAGEEYRLLCNVDIGLPRQGLKKYK
ncbi:MAG: hypothetical protein KDC49_04185 [Saprospiraceae bacterium]|nr:hypothetical protein [Saprospiraceae bacterium]